MKVTIFREACCYQDDQVGPLDAEFIVEANETFFSLIQKIINSGFLQFTSSHSRITGEIDERDLVEIFSTYDEKAGQIEFKVNPNTPAVDLLNEKVLSFYFHHARNLSPVSVST